MRLQVQLVFAALLVSAAVVSAAFDVVTVLSAYPEYSQFRQALQSTGVDKEINAQNSVSVFAVRSLPGGYTPEEVADILRYHTALQAVDNDYITKLPNKTQIFTTLYQRTGRADQRGSVNVTNEPNGSTGLGLVGAAAPSATLVKNVTRMAYEISVFEITNAIEPAGLREAAITNVTEALTQGGQYSTLLTLLESAGLVETVQNLASTGLTLFAPTDAAFNKISDVTRTLTADQVKLVLTYHVVAQYISAQQLLTSNQVLTTASGDTFTLTNINGKATIRTNSGGNATEQTTVADKSPAAIYAIDSVLVPASLFAPSPAPSPGSEAPSPLAPLAPLAPSAPTPVAPLAPLAPSAPVPVSPTSPPAKTPVSPVTPPSSSPSTPRASPPGAANATSPPPPSGAGSVGVSLAVVSSVVVAASAFLF